jgi:hypothetical protein
MRHTWIITTAVLTALAVAGCRSGITGRYADAENAYVLDLNSGGKAQLTFKGDGTPCTYTVVEKKVSLDCAGNQVELTVQDDGSLKGSGFPVILAKK